MYCLRYVIRRLLRKFRANNKHWEQAIEVKESNDGADQVESDAAHSDGDGEDGDEDDEYALDDLLQVTANGGRHLTKKEELGKH